MKYTSTHTRPNFKATVAFDFSGSRDVLAYYVN